MEKQEIGNATLYLGDCAEILPTLGQFDAVVSDPPYGMKLNADFSKMKNKSGFKGVGVGNEYENILNDDKDFDPTHLLISKNVVLFGVDYYIDKLPKGGSISIWDKRINENGDKAFGSCYEMIWFYPKRKKDFLRHCWYGIFGTEKEDVKNRVHPTQKPVGVMEWCINNLDKNIKTIVDPYMGSGSTGIACMNLQKTFVGIEMERKYFDIACKRIEDAQRQERLF